MSDTPILVATQGALRTITLNRPAALNSFTEAMHIELLAALEAAAGDAAVRAVLITGAGRGFCAGQDLNDPAMNGGDVGELVRRLYLPLAKRLRSLPVPTVAAVNGVAAGAGANLALCCDFAVAAKSAVFVQAFSKIALVPDCGGTWLLPRLVGRARALGLAMTGEKLAADEAQAIGLIWRAVEDAELMSSALDLAGRLAALPSRALAETRRLIDAATISGFDAALAAEADAQGELCRAHDYAEGVAAFRARRAPAFKDR